jgi:hypothetical protein
MTLLLHEDVEIRAGLIGVSNVMNRGVGPPLLLAWVLARRREAIRSDIQHNPEEMSRLTGFPTTCSSNGNPLLCHVWS